MARMWDSWEVLRVFYTFYYVQRQREDASISANPIPIPMHDTFKTKITARYCIVYTEK